MNTSTQPTQPPASDTNAPEPAQPVDTGPGHIGTPHTAQTIPQPSTGEGGKLPHERDESGSNPPKQTQDNQTVMGQAKNDLDAGLTDTDRRPPMDSTYEGQKAGDVDHAKTPPRP